MEYKDYNISFISGWTKLCSMALFLVFFHFAIIIPVIEYQQIDISITELMADKENEAEKIEDALEQAINDLLPPLFSQKNSIIIKNTNAEYELHHRLFSPPPEQV